MSRRVALKRGTVEAIRARTLPGRRFVLESEVIELADGRLSVEIDDDLYEVLHSIDEDADAAIFRVLTRQVGHS